MVEHVWGDRLFSATPMYVVEDMRDAVRLWCPAGTRVQMAWTPQQCSRPDVTRLETLVDCLTNEDWVLIEEEVRTSSLWLMEAGRGYALAYFWLGGSPLGWYVNLQEPPTWIDAGLQTMDQALDVIVDRNLNWAWKDEDELQTTGRPRARDAAEG